ncbi:hypothetical protein GCM10009757_26930 [Streptomyces cheonanensis]|uniref:Uncharacterized protein n=1 Tax=Streptomyces cheonanensis TaxID=312720 RepID=A0ABN2V6X0_9ACTN
MLPELSARVRFPSPALHTKAQVTDTVQDLGLRRVRIRWALRARSVSERALVFVVFRAIGPSGGECGAQAVVRAWAGAR